MILDAVTKSIQVILGGAVTANELHCYAAYADHTTSLFTPRSNDTLTTGATAVTVVAGPPISTQRQVKYLSVYNADTSTATVTVRLLTGGTARTLVKVALATLEQLVYDHANGWQVITASGASKTVGPAGNSGEIQWNNNGIFGASANLSWDNTNNKLKLGDGAVGHPSYTFLNSATTGFWRQAADVIGIAIAGVERFRLNATDLGMDAAIRARMLSQNRFRYLNPICRVYRSAVQSIGNAAFTNIQWNNEGIDTDGMHDNVTNNDRVTVQVAGKYLAVARVAFAGSAAGTLRAARLLPSAGGGGDRHDAVPSATTDLGMPLHAIANMSVGDFWIVDVFQDSGGNLNTSGAESYMHLEVFYIGE